jgi:hypothetical protein
MQYMDRTIQNTEVFDIVFNGICSIEVPAKNTLVEITQTDLPIDFLKNIGYIEGNVTISGNGNGVRHSASEWLSEIRGTIWLTGLEFENYITNVPLTVVTINGESDSITVMNNSSDTFIFKQCKFGGISSKLSGWSLIRLEGCYMESIATEIDHFGGILIRGSRADMIARSINGLGFIEFHNTHVENFVDINGTARDINNVEIYHNCTFGSIVVDSMNMLHISRTRVSLISGNFSVVELHMTTVDVFENLDSLVNTEFKIEEDVSINGYGTTAGKYIGQDLLYKVAPDELDNDTHIKLLIENIKREKESGNVDYLAPFVDEINKLFTNEIILKKTQESYGGVSVVLAYNEGIDYPDNLQFLIYGGICGIDGGLRQAEIKNPPATFLKNIYFITGNVVDIYANNRYRYEPSQNLNVLIGDITMHDFQFSSYITTQPISKPSKTYFRLQDCKLDTIAPSIVNGTITSIVISGCEMNTLKMTKLCTYSHESTLKFSEIKEVNLGSIEGLVRVSNCHIETFRVKQANARSYDMRFNNCVIDRFEDLENFKDNSEPGNGDFKFNFEDGNNLVAGVKLPDCYISSYQLKSIIDNGHF